MRTPRSFRLPALGLAVLLMSCSSTAPLPLEAPPQRTPEVRPPAASVAPPPTTASRDSCGAAEVQRLVGHPRSEIPVPIQPDRQRVLCTTCPMTMDYRPDRLNFFFDAETGRIKEIRCG